MQALSQDSSDRLTSEVLASAHSKDNGKCNDEERDFEMRTSVLRKSSGLKKRAPGCRENGAVTIGYTRMSVRDSGRSHSLPNSPSLGQFGVLKLLSQPLSKTLHPTAHALGMCAVTELEPPFLQVCLQQGVEGAAQIKEIQLHCNFSRVRYLRATLSLLAHSHRIQATSLHPTHFEPSILSCGGSCDVKGKQMVTLPLFCP